MATQTKDQLHQLLAVENDRKQKALQIVKETATVFQKKQDHFDGLQKSYHPYEEGGQKVEPEIKEIVTTVDEKLSYTQKSVVIAIDATISKEETNASGMVRAQLEVGEKDFGELSATSLLALESWLNAIRTFYKEIPTLDPVKTWVPDQEAEKKGVFRTEVETKYRTQKTEMPMIMYDATKEHPAQVQVVTKDVQVGEYHTVYRSGKITPAKKSEVLGRIDDLVDAIKRARARANKAEVLHKKIGKAIFDFIEKG